MTTQADLDVTHWKEVYFERMVIPRSFSRTLESIARSSEEPMPHDASRRSMSVVFPWSMCAAGSGSRFKGLSFQDSHHVPMLWSESSWRSTSEISPWSPCAARFRVQISGFKLSMFTSCAWAKRQQAVLQHGFPVDVRCRVRVLRVNMFQDLVHI